MPWKDLKCSPYTAENGAFPRVKLHVYHGPANEFHVWSSNAAVGASINKGAKRITVVTGGLVHGLSSRTGDRIDSRRGGVVVSAS